MITEKNIKSVEKMSLDELKVHNAKALKMMGYHIAIREIIQFVKLTTMDDIMAFKLIDLIDKMTGKTLEDFR